MWSYWGTSLSQKEGTSLTHKALEILPPLLRRAPFTGKTSRMIRASVWKFPWNKVQEKVTMRSNDIVNE